MSKPRKAVDRDGNSTTNCSAYANGVLQNEFNKYVYGDAWNLNDGKVIFSGYGDLPRDISKNEILKIHNAASQNFYKNFDSKTLDPSHVYTVNMYYSNSPHMEEAYNTNTKTPGTHTGVAYFDKDSNKWMVTHNIHGDVHEDPFTSIQGAGRAYGITSISDLGVIGEDNRPFYKRWFNIKRQGGRLIPRSKFLNLS